MKLSELQLFAELVKNQLNISRTAQNMSMAQSGVTRKIQALEKSLGASLAIRQGKKLVGLTEFGHIVLDKSRSLLLQADNLHSLVAEYHHNSEVNMAIATTNTQARYFLPDIIVSFKELFPEVGFNFLQGNPQQLISYLYEGLADIAICTESLAEDMNLHVHECYQWNHAIVVQKNHPLAEKEHLSLEDIAAYPILTYAFYLTGGGRIRTAFRQAELSIRIIFTALDTEVIKTYVRLGYGVGIIAGMARDASDEDLVYRPLDHLIEHSVTKIAWLKEKYLNKQTREFIALASRKGNRLGQQLSTKTTHTIHK